MGRESVQEKKSEGRGWNWLVCFISVSSQSAEPEEAGPLIVKVEGAVKLGGATWDAPENGRVRSGAAGSRTDGRDQLELPRAAGTVEAKCEKLNSDAPGDDVVEARRDDLGLDLAGPAGSGLKVEVLHREPQPVQPQLVQPRPAPPPETPTAAAPSCRKQFSLESSLQKHVARHSRKRAHTCPLCGKGFPYRYHLSNHCTVHTGERPFHCSICTKSFSHPSNLRRHHRIQHERP